VGTWAYRRFDGARWLRAITDGSPLRAPTRNGAGRRDTPLRCRLNTDLVAGHLIEDRFCFGGATMLRRPARFVCVPSLQGDGLKASFGREDGQPPQRTPRDPWGHAVLAFESRRSVANPSWKAVLLGAVGSDRHRRGREGDTRTLLLASFSCNSNGRTGYRSRAKAV